MFKLAYVLLPNRPPHDVETDQEDDEKKKATKAVRLSDVAKMEQAIQAIMGDKAEATIHQLHFWMSTPDASKDKLVLSPYAFTKQTLDWMPLCAWWPHFAGETLPELAELAEKIFSMRPTTAAAERCWSTFGRIARPERRIMKTKTLEKLAFIYFNQRALDRKDAAEPMAPEKLWVSL